MLRTFILSLFCLIGLISTQAQDPIKETAITIIDQYDDMNGYYIFSPKGGSEKVVVFVHGYGALNPAIYGNWILHLVEEKELTVIFPRYQENIFNPSTEQFPETMSAGIRAALDTLNSLSTYNTKDIYYAGHSYGGAAVAFFASEYAEYNLPKPKAVLSAQPGTGFFKAMTLDYYDKIEHDIPLILISGDDDVVVGDRICRLVHATIKSDNFRHVHHYPDIHDGNKLQADHHAPYDINLRLDNGVRNLSTTRAMHDTQHDLEDTELYQRLLDELIDGSALDDILPIGEWTYAKWSDGTPVKPALVK